MNVCNHFEFMKFLITKKYCDGSDVTNEEIEKYFELGCEGKGLGRGHINRIKDKVRKRKMG